MIALIDAWRWRLRAPASDVIKLRRSAPPYIQNLRPRAPQCYASLLQNAGEFRMRAGKRNDLAACPLGFPRLEFADV
jgi:hypothetical protein